MSQPLVKRASTSSNSSREARTGEKLIRRLCSNERTLDKAISLYNTLQNTFAHDALPNVCAYLACEILGNVDVTWEAASLAASGGEPACMDLWRSVRQHLCKFSPTVSYLSLVRVYSLTVPEAYIDVMKMAEDRARTEFSSIDSCDSVLFAVFVWAGMLLKIDNITPSIVADDYDLDEGELKRHVQVVANKNVSLASEILKSFQPRKTPRGGTVLDFVLSMGIISKTHVSSKTSTSPKAKSPLKRSRGPDDDEVKKESPQPKRHNTGLPSKHSSTHPTSRLDALRRAIPMGVPLSNPRPYKNDKQDHEMIRLREVIDNTTPVKPSYVGSNPWKKHTKSLSPDEKVSIKTPHPETGHFQAPSKTVQSYSPQIKRSASDHESSQRLPTRASASEAASSSPKSSPPDTLVNEAPSSPTTLSPPRHAAAPATASTPSAVSLASITISQAAQLLLHIRRADWAIITHISAFSCPNIVLKLKILDLKTRIAEREKIPADGDQKVAQKLDEFIQIAREDITKYVREDTDACGSDIELKLKVLDLETRMAEWRRLSMSGAGTSVKNAS